MKKILFLGMIVVGVFANRYPILLEYNYMVGCMNGANSIKENIKRDYCICTLKAMENKYSANEIIEKLSDPQQKREVINYVVNKCINIIKKGD